MRKEYNNRWGAKRVNPGVTLGEWNARKRILASLFQKVPVVKAVVLLPWVFTPFKK